MRKSLAILFLLSGALLFAQETGDWYQGKPIRDISFAGLKHITAEELSGIVEPYIGKPYGDNLFFELNGRLWALEYFREIAPETARMGDGVAIRFTVVEQPRISRIVFSGNKGLARRELLDTISLKVNDVATDIRRNADEGALLAKYLEKGYPGIRIRSEIQPSREGDTALLVFYIEEGERLIISAIRFTGNDAFSEKNLRGQLSLKTKGFFNDGAFQEAKLVADRAAILRYYHDRGYIDAQIIDVSRDVRRDAQGANGMILTFHLFEGSAYTYLGTTFEGNRIFDTETLEKLVYSRRGRTVNQRQVEADFQRVAGLYFQNGYIFNTITPETRRNAEDGTVAYHIAIVERGRAHVENILIRGNFKTKDHVIFREIPLEPGDIFSQSKIMDAYRNLYNLQFFSAVNVDTQPGSEDGLMNLYFDVEEQPTTNVQLGMTFSGTSDPSEFPVALVFQLQDRNFLGFGNTLGGDLNLSRDTQSGSINYTHRWIFGLPLDGGFDFTVSRSKRLDLMNNSPPFFNGDESYAFPDGFSSREEYETTYPASEYLMPIERWTFSLGFSTGYRWLTPFGNLLLRGGTRVGLEHNYYDELLYRPFDPVLREQNDRLVPALSLWTGLSLDSRDIYYDPSKGYYASTRLGYYGFLPGEREFYLKLENKGEIFFTLFNLPVTDTWSFKGVLGFHTGLSFVLPHPFAPADNNPKIEAANMLYIDGMFIGRGWDSKRLITRGRALWDNWAELRFPLVPGMLALDFFFDAVTWSPSPTEFFSQGAASLLNNMYFSLGFGPRITIPQFPFRFLFVSRFRVQDGKVEWEPGSMGPLKFVLSLSIPVI
jgi:outer membrane protein insertion porin family